MASIHGVRGPIVSPEAGPTHLVSVQLELTPQERSAVDNPSFAPDGLVAAFQTMDFRPRKVRCVNGEMVIDYPYVGEKPSDIAELCRSAVESKLNQFMGQ